MPYAIPLPPELWKPVWISRFFPLSYAIEQVLQKCPVIFRCLVVAIDDPKHFHGKCAKALIVLKSETDGETGKESVKKFIHDNLPSFIRPAQVEFVDRLPTTKNGKLDYFIK